MKAFLTNHDQHKDVVQLLLNENESKQLYWENKNEFRYNDEMYDVVEKKVEGNKIIIRCISDNKETSLLNEYRKNNKSNSSNSTIVHLITTQFVLPVDHSLKQPERIIKKVFVDPSSSLQNATSTVLAPPPEVC